MKLTRNLTAAMLAATGCFAFAFAGVAHADWPERPVTILVHSGAGSSTDLMARSFARAAEEVTGQSFIVEVKGKETMPALQRAPADGYTLATQTRGYLGELAIGTGFHKMEDFQWVNRLVGEIPVYAVQYDSKYQSFADLVKAAAENPRSLTLATYTAGSTVWADAMKVVAAAGVEFNVIPYGSSSETVVALLGGNVDMASSYPSQMVQAVEAKKARVVVVGSSERLPLLPDSPTLKELGYDFVLSHWRGLIGKKGIPEDVLNQIDAVAQKIVETQVFTEWADLAGVDVEYLDHAEAQTRAEAEYDEVFQYFKETGLIQ